MDPDIDFAAMFSRFDTLLIGRRSFEAMQAMGGDVGIAHEVRLVVISQTMRQADFPNVTIVDDLIPFVTELKEKPGKLLTRTTLARNCFNFFTAEMTMAVVMRK
jgi:dihydrofolate reductase